ncbi:MAG: glycosyltransferase family 4 protein [Gammaproteobacteria bacterium]|nr:glycosyltransferase family 4 protein [Gammaproteobacteria bacterium]
MKLLHIELGRHRYGGVQQVAYLIAGLQRQGVDNTVVCAHGSETAAAFADLGAKCLPIRCLGDFDISLIGRLRSIIAREQPDIVHLHSRRGADVWGGIAAHGRVPVVLSRRVDNPERPAWWRRYKYQHYDRVVAISHGIRDVLLDYGVDGERLRVVHSAIDTNQLRPPADDTAKQQAKIAFHRRYAIPLDRLVIATVAQLIPRKGHAEMMRALPVVLQRHPNVVWLLFGQGHEEAKLRYLRRKARLLRQVRFMGYEPMLPQFLAGVDLFVHPAQQEGLGVALLEAASCGLPIVATRAGGIPEIIKDGETGLLVGPKNIPGLASAILGLLGNQNWAQQLGRNARRHVEENFSIDAMVHGNLAVYKEMVNK